MSPEEKKNENKMKMFNPKGPVFRILFFTSSTLATVCK